MRHIDTGWSEPSFWDRFRLLFFILLALVIMSLLSALFIGADGLLRMIGLKDDSFKSVLSISTEPQEALIYVDFKQVENPFSTTVSWIRGTDHVIEVNHPSCVPEKMIIKIPVNSSESPEVIPTSDSIVWESNAEDLTVIARLRPEFLKMKIETKPTGAAIEINGVATQKVTPFFYEFKTGEVFHIVASKSGYETASFDFEVPYHDKKEPVVIELQKSKKPAPAKTGVPVPATGTLRVKSSYPVDVYSGSKRILHNRKTADVPLATGKHAIRLTNRDFLLDQEQTVTIKKNQIHSITIEPPGKVILVSEPPGATVMIGDYTIGNTPGTFEIAPGMYEVVFYWSACSDTKSSWVKVVSEQTRRIPPIKGCR